MKSQPPIEWPEENQNNPQSRLFTHGTKLSEVPPDFHGISLREWEKVKMQLIAEQGSEISRKFLGQFLNGVPDDDARTLGKRIATPRDNYGWKSL